MHFRLREVEYLLHERQPVTKKMIRAGRVIQLYLRWIWPRGVRDILAPLARVCTKCVTYFYRSFLFWVNKGL